jgi:TM2 domain-containing membrane protein YozV
MEAAGRATSAPNDTAAAVLSLVIPGAGQIYKGRTLAGLLWLVFTAAGYVTVLVPGMFLHFLCVFQAYWMPTAERR